MNTNQPNKVAIKDSVNTVGDKEKLVRFFRSAQFEISAAKFAQCPVSDVPEVAFAGRSNAGKSSAINRITDNKKLAKTSKTPGRTQLINFFQLKNESRLVDLPGYGFAKVGLAQKHQWQQLMESYLEKRENLKLLILVMDCRHPLQPIDHVMLDWTEAYQMPCHILLTKSDKLSKNQSSKTLADVKKLVSKDTVTTQLFSALNGTGLDKAHEILAKHLYS